MKIKNGRKIVASLKIVYLGSLLGMWIRKAHSFDSTQRNSKPAWTLLSPYLHYFQSVIDLLTDMK